MYNLSDRDNEYELARIARILRESGDPEHLSEELYK
jgi:hypothetical protein